jgi:hypothetical protein
VHFSRSLPSNSWWQTMAGWQVLSRPSAAEGGGRRPAFTGLATQPYSATEVDGWQHKLSRVSQNRAAVHKAESFDGDLVAHVRQEPFFEVPLINSSWQFDTHRVRQAAGNRLASFTPAKGAVHLDKGKAIVQRPANSTGACGGVHANSRAPELDA